jgi:hypothetical protein
MNGIGSEGVEWIHLAQERVQWRAAVNSGDESFCSRKDGELYKRVTISEAAVRFHRVA